jgi:hypothetical protein
MFDVIEVAIDQCRLAANNKIHNVVVDIGYLDILDFGMALNPEMEANAISFSTIEPGANFNEVVIRGILPE